MVCLQIMNFVFFPISISSGFRKKNLSFNTCRGLHGQRCRIRCAGDNKSNGEEPPESLFMKELKRRGMTPTSLLEDVNYGLTEEMETREEMASFSTRKVVSNDYQKSLANQRQRSMELNSEGLEGLVPRAKLLLTLGGTFFLGFWPLILSTIAFFSALYFYFGSSFVHDGSEPPVSLPQYIDPYALLEDERISGTTSPLN